MIERAIQDAVQVARPGAGDLAAQAAAAQKGLRKSAIPPEIYQAFRKKMDINIYSIKNSAQTPMFLHIQQPRIVKDILIILKEFISDYKQDGLKELNKDKKTLQELRAIKDDDLKQILDARIELGDFQEILDDLTKILPPAPTPAAIDNDW